MNTRPSRTSVNAWAVGALVWTHTDAVHIGLVLRVTPVLMLIEGNTTIGRYDRNGFVQALKEVDRSRVLCYVLPRVAVAASVAAPPGSQIWLAMGPASYRSP